MATKKAKRNSKMDVATQLFKRYYGKKTRAEIVNILVEKADLTKAGANSWSPITALTSSKVFSPISSSELPFTAT